MFGGPRHIRHPTRIPVQLMRLPVQHIHGLVLLLAAAAIATAPSPPPTPTPTPQTPPPPPPSRPHPRTVCASRPYRYLALEGGGVKGIAYGGAVRALEDRGLLRHIEGFAGSSAGSSAAAMLAAGYDGAELLQILMDMDFSKLLEDDNSAAAETGDGGTEGGGGGGWSGPAWIGRVNPFGLPPSLVNLRRLLNHFGWYSGVMLERYAETMLSAKTGVANVTFAQLYTISGKLLRLTGTSVTTGSMRWFDVRHSPHMRVAKAVRISSSIPFFFQPVEHDGELYVDGGALRSLPLDAFADFTPPEGGDEGEGAGGSGGGDGGGAGEGEGGGGGSGGSRGGGGTTLALSIRYSAGYDLGRGESVRNSYVHLGDYANRLLEILMWYVRTDA